MTSSCNNGWQEGKTLKECMLKILEDEIMCDVTFVVGEDKVKKKAHKYMLASRSPVFYTMFEGSCPEPGDVIVPDIDAETFKFILRYIYSDEVKLTIENLEQVLYAADKYMLTSFKMASTTLMQNNINCVNAVRLLQVAMTFEMGELHTKCLEYFIKYASECIQEPSAVDVSKECVESILKLDKMNCQETELCKYFLKWLSHQCKIKGKDETRKNMRVLAGDLLYLLRFPVVNRKYFAENFAQPGLLSSEEIIEVFRSHNNVECSLFNWKSRRQNFLDFEMRYTSKNCGPYVDDRFELLNFF